MDLWQIAVRAIIAYIYLFFTTRASGKRTIGQATPFDFIVSLIVGDLVDDALWAEVSMAKFGAAVGSIFICDAIDKILASQFAWFHRLVNGLPTIVLRDGVEDRKELKREQLSIDDLTHLCRLHGLGIEKWNEIRLGLFERDHSVATLPPNWAEPAQRKDAAAVAEMVK